VHLADPNTGNAAQMAAAVGHIEVVEKLVEAGCAWPHGKKAHSGLGAPVDVVALLAQKSGVPVSVVLLSCCSNILHWVLHAHSVDMVAEVKWKKLWWLVTRLRPGHIEVVEKLVEAGCAWPHGKKAHSGLGAPVDVVALLAQKSGVPVSHVCFSVESF
jgi:hypothetical protein